MSHSLQIRQIKRCQQDQLINLQNQSQESNKYNMPSKLQAYLQNYRHLHNQNHHLPTLSNQLPAIQKKLIKHKIQAIKKQQNSKTNLTYSRNKIFQNPVKLLKNVKRIATQQNIQQYNQLSKIQQNIMMQIKNIDVCLQSQRNHKKQKQKTSLYGGYIFLNQIDDFVIQKFYDCLQIQSEASNAIIDGFDVPKLITGSDGQPDLIDANIVKKVSSINNKLLNKSIKAIQQYDKQKNHQYEKNYGKQWSLFKRDLPISNQNHQLLLQKSLITQNISNDSKITFINSFKSRLKNQSKSTNLFQSKITSNSKNTFIGDLSFIKRSRQTKISGNSSTAVKTEPIENQETEQNLIVKLTKRDVRAMLTKHKNIISIWIPPASYPQFFGIFSYKIIKFQKQQQIPVQTIYKCKITRYFFYKFGLSNKVFNAIIEWVSYQNNMFIQSLQITLDKTLYSKVFAKMGWTLKFWQSAYKVKAVYQNPFQKDNQKKV